MTTKSATGAHLPGAAESLRRKGGIPPAALERLRRAGEITDRVKTGMTSDTGLFERLAFLPGLDIKGFIGTAWEALEKVEPFDREIVKVEVDHPLPLGCEERVREGLSPALHDGGLGEGRATCVPALVHHCDRPGVALGGQRNRPYSSDADRPDVVVVDGTRLREVEIPTRPRSRIGIVEVLARK